MNGIAVITGTTHGIGRITSRELARAGYVVVMLCRDLPAAGIVRDEILAQVPQAAIHLVYCDLASLACVRECALAVRGAVGPISILINNAGMVSTRRRMTVDGFELTFATNYLGPFLLTSLLLDHMTKSARIVNVASRAHYRGKLDLRRVTNRQARYGASAAYSQSKLANVMHTFALARRLSRTQVTVNCLHPGVVATNLLPRWLRVVKPMISHVLEPECAARTCMNLALASDVSGTSGCYFDEHRTIQPASQLASDVALQEMLWDTSARWTDAWT